MPKNQIECSKFFGIFAREKERKVWNSSEIDKENGKIGFVSQPISIKTESTTKT